MLKHLHTFKLLIQPQNNHSQMLRLIRVQTSRSEFQIRRKIHSNRIIMKQLLAATELVLSVVVLQKMCRQQQLLFLGLLQKDFDFVKHTVNIIARICVVLLGDCQLFQVAAPGAFAEAFGSFCESEGWLLLEDGLLGDKYLGYNHPNTSPTKPRW
jgi:hypothetical protein